MLKRLLAALACLVPLAAPAHAAVTFNDLGKAHLVSANPQTFSPGSSVVAGEPLVIGVIIHSGATGTIGDSGSQNAIGVCTFTSSNVVATNCTAGTAGACKLTRQSSADGELFLIVCLNPASATTLDVITVTLSGAVEIAYGIGQMAGNTSATFDVNASQPITNTLALGVPGTGIPAQTYNTAPVTGIAMMGAANVAGSTTAWSEDTTHTWNTINKTPIGANGSTMILSFQNFGSTTGAQYLPTFGTTDINHAYVGAAASIDSSTGAVFHGLSANGSGQ
jgi:hypothetical protein